MVLGATILFVGLEEVSAAGGNKRAVGRWREKGEEVSENGWVGAGEERNCKVKGEKGFFLGFLLRPFSQIYESLQL